MKNCITHCPFCDKENEIKRVNKDLVARCWHCNCDVKQKFNIHILDYENENLCSLGRIHFIRIFLDYQDKIYQINSLFGNITVYNVHGLKLFEFSFQEFQIDLQNIIDSMTNLLSKILLLKEFQ